MILAKESFGMPQLAAALSITNMMNPHLFFFSSSLWKLLAGDFLIDLLNLEEKSLPQNQSRASGRMGWGRAARRGRVAAEEANLG